MLPWMLLAGAAIPAAAQYPGHTQQNDTKKAKPPRAIAVLEWTGAPGKPSASRIVPVSVFVDGEYQDAGLYMAQPAPLAVERDTVYELQQAGVPKGMFDLAGGENMLGTWYGFGQWKPLAPPPPVKKLKPARVPARIVQDNDPDRPQLKRSGSGAGAGGTTSTSSTAPSSGSSGSSTSSDDPDKPTLHRRTDSGSGTQDSSSSGSASSGGSSTGAASGSPSSTSSTSSSGSTSTADSDDPDKPTLHRRGDSGDSGQASSGAGTAPDDPDRPHLTKHSDSSTTAASADDEASVGMAKNIDPDRPQMLHGKPAVSEQQLEASKLTGLPPDLQQMAAVSDSATHEEHPFVYQWPSPDDAAKMQAAVEALAINAALPARPAAAKTTTPPVARPGAPRSTLAHRVPVKPPPVKLTQEEFHAFELSYSGGPTVVLTATAEIGPNNAGTTVEKYVTIVAQPDFDGVPQVRLQSVTDPDHLDITPRMRLVDAVDAQGDNRAELLFEMRRKNDRQFALYKVLGLHAEQAFATEPLPYGALSHVEIKTN
jgi:hypothetical protein